MAMSGDIFGCHTGGKGAPGTWQVEAKDGAEHFRTYRKTSAMKRCLAPKLIGLRWSSLHLPFRTWGARLHFTAPTTFVFQHHDQNRGERVV